MEYEDFRNFERLAQELHFGRAARSLGMSPSALTRRIQALEEELDAALLLRDPRQVRLTSAGERFRRFARAELERFEQLKAELRDEISSPSGELHIACTVTACLTVLPRLLALCRERYPRLTLRLITQDASQSLEQLEAGEVDLAVIPTDDPPPEHLVLQVLDGTALAFIGPADPRLLDALGLTLPTSQFSPTRAQRPLQPGEPLPVPFVAPLAGLERQRLESWIHQKQLDARFVAEVRGNEGIIAMVSLGTGIGLVPELVLESSPLRSRVQILEELTPPPGYAVSLCARPKSLNRNAVRAFFQLAEEESPGPKRSRTLKRELD